MKKLTQPEIKDLVQQYLREALQSAEEYRAPRDKPFSPEEWKANFTAINFLLDDEPEALAFCDYRIRVLNPIEFYDPIPQLH